jgi:hypothetical protein
MHTCVLVMSFGANSWVVTNYKLQIKFVLHSFKCINDYKDISLRDISSFMLACPIVVHHRDCRPYVHLLSLQHNAHFIFKLIHCSLSCYHNLQVMYLVVIHPLFTLSFSPDVIVNDRNF